MTDTKNDGLIELVKHTLLASLRRHSRDQYGTVADIPYTANHGDYLKVVGYVGLHDVAVDIANAAELCVLRTAARAAEAAQLETAL